MKKWAILLLTLVALCSLVACGDPNANSGSPSYSYEASVSWTNWSDDPMIRESALNREQFDPASETLRFPIYRCDTLEELNRFKSDFSGIFTLDSGRDEVPSFQAVTADYTESFFEEHDLLLVYVTDGSCTPRYGVESLSGEKGTLTVHIECTYAPEVGDCAMAGWLMTVAVNSEEIRDCTEFDAILS